MTSCRKPSAVSCHRPMGGWLVGWAVGDEEAEGATGHPCGDVREGAWGGEQIACS